MPKAKILASALRTSTSPSAILGCASTSLDTRERHFTTPDCASSAITSPSSAATTTSEPSVPTPLEMRLPSDTRHLAWPEAASSRATVPARDAA